jgi:hypothetical protein
MKKFLQTLSTSALSVLGFSILSIGSAQAASISVSSVSGSANTDYYVYGVNGASQTVRIAETLANVNAVLSGNATNPTGNVELRASSELPSFDFTKNTSLVGTIGGQAIVLSSLTESDWINADFGKTWFNAALSAYGLGGLNSTVKGIFYNAFVNSGGRQRFSDPNISYVNQDSSGKISIGLAGHYNALDLVFNAVPAPYQSIVSAALVGKVVQASEIVKYTYEGKMGYLFSFNATSSGLSAQDDGISHTGNYEVYLYGQPRPVPVPAAFVGVVVAGAFGATKLKRSKVTSLS